MTDEKYKKYIMKKGFSIEYFDNLYDIIEYWKDNPGYVDYLFTYKNIDYVIQVEYFPGPNHGKPFVAYYLKPDFRDEHITYFDSFEEMLENYHLQDGTLLLDYMTDPKYADAE